MGSQVRNICTRNPRDKRPLSSMYMDITRAAEARGPCESLSVVVGEGDGRTVCAYHRARGASSVGLACIASWEVIGGSAGYRHGDGGCSASDGRVGCKRPHSVEEKIAPLLYRVSTRHIYDLFWS